MLKALILVCLSGLASLFVPPEPSRSVDGIVSVHAYNSTVSVVEPLKTTDFTPQGTLDRVYKLAFSTKGNLYAPGNCTFFVKEQRPDIPNLLGNAREWLANLEDLGFPTGAIPKVNAIGWKIPGKSLGHVVYVTEVYPDGSFKYRAMNERGLGVINEEVVPAQAVSKWLFIY